MKRNSKEFRKLQQEWYDKIEEDGFDDIETFDQEGEAQHWLKNNHKFTSIHPDQVAQDQPQHTFEAIRDYYIQAEHLLNQDVFDNTVDRFIWKMHVDGMSLRHIGKHVKFSHVKVMRIINIYKLRHFTSNK